MDVQVRHAATDAEREAIYRLRYDTYVEELRLFRGQADHARLRLTDAHDATAHLLYAEVAGEVVGTLRLHLGADAPFPASLAAPYAVERFLPWVPWGRLALGGRFMVRPEWRGSPVPLELLTHAVRWLHARGVALIFVDCQTHLLNLYRSLGFRACGGAFNHPEWGLMVPLIMVVGDRAHLERVGSPLRHQLPEEASAAEVAAQVEPLLEQAAPVLSPEGPESAGYWTEVYQLLNQKQRHIFEGLSEAEMQAVLASSHVIPCAPGDSLIRRGQTARTVFVVLSGALEVRDGERVVAVASEGEVVGEVAFLLSTPRISDVRALEEGARVLALSEEALRSLIDSSSRAAALLLLNLSRGLALKLVQRAAGSR